MNGQKINIIFLNTSPGSVYCLRLSVWKITKYKIYQNEERISFLNKVNSDQRKQSRAKLYAKSCQIPRVAWILPLRWNLHIKTCVFVTFWNMLRDSKCCKANFSVIIDNTKNNFSEFSAVVNHLQSCMCVPVWLIRLHFIPFLTLKETVVDFVIAWITCWGNNNNSRK